MAPVLSDSDAIIAAFAAFTALACLYLSARAFAKKHVVYGLMWLASAALFGVSALFYTAFTIRLF